MPSQGNVSRQTNQQENQIFSQAIIKQESGLRGWGRINCNFRADSIKPHIKGLLDAI